MATVSFRKIEKAYGKVKVIHGIGFDIADGEFVVLVGPSGCGKSTLLRMLAGLEEITGGEILIDDKVVNDLESKDRDIAMVFQSYALYPHMTVRENMAFSLKLRKADAALTDQRVLDAARILNLDPLLERYPRELSGGQRQRVAMGRAIVRDPKVFLFDEPLSNLDAKLRVAMRAEIKALHQRLKTTTVYVTHDQIEAMTMADRIVVMHDGLIEQIGTPLALYDHPANLFVAQFIGSPSMNVIKGTLRGAGGSTEVEAAGSRWPVPAQIGGAGGQRQRVAMGRAIVRDPKVFLFDEPLSKLDAKMRVQMRTEIKKVHQKVRTTTVYVTHDQIEAMTLADRVVVMNAGRIEQVGAPNDLYHTPATKFVAGFIGSPAMNFAPCALEEAAGALRVRLSGEVAFPVPQDRTQRYRAHIGKPRLLFGLRPEHIMEQRPQLEPNQHAFEVELEVVEPMGMETMVFFLLDGTELCGRVNPNAGAQAFKRMKLVADLSNMHLIDDASGKVL